MSADTTALQRGLNDAQGHMGKLTGILKTGAIAGGAAIAGLGVAAVKMGMDFEKSMAEVRTLLPQMGDEAFGALQDDLIAFSKELGIATDQAVPALYQAISAGVPPENVMTFMETAAKASIGGVTDLETAVNGITSVINAYGTEVLSAAEAGDILFTGIRLGKTTFSELSASLYNVVPIAAAAGISFEEITAALAALTAQGVPTAQATTQLRAAIQALAAPTATQKKLMEELGLSFDAATLESIGLEGAFQLMMKTTGGNMEQLRELVGSVEALQAILALGGEQSYKFTEALAEMETAAGATDAAFATVAETASYKFQVAMNLLKTTLMEIGLKAIPYITAALNTVIPWLETHLPEAVGFIEEKVDALTDAFDDLERETADLRDAADDLAKGLDDLKKSFAELNVEMPNTSIIMKAMGTVHVSQLTAAMGTLGNMFSAIAALLRGDLTAAFEYFSASVLAPWGVAWAQVRGIVADAMVGAARIVESALNAIIGLINDFAGQWAKVAGPLERITNQLNLLGGGLDLTIRPIDRVNLRLDDFDSYLRGASGSLDRLDDDVFLTRQNILRFGDAVGDTGNEVFDVGAFLAGLTAQMGGAGGAAAAAAEEFQGLDADLVSLYVAMTNLAETGIVNLNAAILAEEGYLADLEQQLQDVTNEIRIQEDALRGWRDTALEGTRAFSDTLFNLGQQANKIQMHINALQLLELREGFDESGRSTDAMRAKIEALAKAFDVELSPSLTDAEKYEAVMAELRDRISEVSLEASQVRLRESITLGPDQREIAQAWEDMAGYSEDTLENILAGGQAAYDALQSLGLMETWLEGIIANHEELLDKLREQRDLLVEALADVPSHIAAVAEARLDEIVDTVEEAMAAIERGEVSAAEALLADAQALYETIQGLVPGGTMSGLLAPLEAVLREAESSIDIDIASMTDTLKGAMEEATGETVSEAKAQILALYMILSAVGTTRNVLFVTQFQIRDYLHDIADSMAEFVAAVPLAQSGMTIGRSGFVHVEAGEVIVPPLALPAGAPTTVIHYHNEFSGPLLGDQRQLEELADQLAPVLARRHFR